MDTLNVAILTILFVINNVSCNGSDQIVQISLGELNTLKESVRRLERFAENQISVNERLETELEHQQNHIKDLRNVILRQAEQIQRHEKLQQQQQEQKVNVPSNGAAKNSGRLNHISKRLTGNTVAFFAVLTTDSLDHLGVHQNIVFEDVVTNTGNGYNSHQGVFVTPVSGLYLITTSVLSRQNREFWAAVVVNGIEVVRLNGRGTDGRHGTGTQTLILSLNKGDDVSVQNILQSDDDYWGQKYSSFGGYLIEDYGVEPAIVG